MTHAKITAMLFQACPGEKRDHLARLLEGFSFAVADLAGIRADDGSNALGLYVPSEHQIYLSPAAVAHGDCVCLALYLHEACHAGAFSGGRPIIRHSDEFIMRLQEAMERYGLEMSEEAFEYNIRDIQERAAARQPAGVALLGVLACAGAAIYASLQGWQVAGVGCLVAAMAVVLSLTIGAGGRRSALVLLAGRACRQDTDLITTVD